VISPLIGLVAGMGAIVSYSAIRIATAGLLGGDDYRPPLPAGEGLTVKMPMSHPWLVILVLVVGGLLSGLVVFMLALEAEGHGTDAAITSGATRTYRQSVGGQDVARLAIARRQPGSGRATRLRSGSTPSAGDNGGNVRDRPRRRDEEQGAGRRGPTAERANPR
jgi:hypothetical protein